MRSVSHQKNDSETLQRRRSVAQPISLRRSIYDWTAILLLLMAPTAGVFLFGAVRLWSIGPLLLLSTLGIAMFFLRPCFAGDLQFIRTPPGGLLWVVFIAYSAMMIPRAAVPYDARIEALKICSYFGAYWAWTELLARKRRWRIVLGILLFLITLIAWYAIVQHARGTRFVLNLIRPESYHMRASGTYFCPNHFAHLLELVLPVSLVLMCMRASKWPLRILAGYSFVLFLPVMFLTQSRSGWIGTAVGLFVTLCLIGLRKGKKIFLIVFLAVPLLFAMTAIGFWYGSDTVRTRVRGAMVNDQPDGAVRIRIEIWKDTLPMIKDKPWVGHGPAAYQWVYPRFRQNSVQLLFNYAHNEYLHLTADYGVIGLGLFAAFLVAAVLRMLCFYFKADRDRDVYLVAGFMGALTASLAHAFFDFNFHIFANNHVLIMLAGIVASCFYSSGVKAPIKMARWQARCFGGVGFIATMVLAALILQILLSYGFTLLGEKCREKFDMDKALIYYQKAKKIDPANWTPYLGIANVLQVKSFWNLDPEEKRQGAEESIRYYEAALERNPYELESLFGLSKAYNSLGDQKKALEALMRAVSYDKHHLFYVTHLGLQLRRMGRDDEALKVFKHARSIGSAEMIDLNIRLLEEKRAAQQGSTPAP